MIGRGQVASPARDSSVGEEADRLVRTGLMTAAAAHEVRNLVTAIRAQAHVGLHSRRRGAKQEALTTILKAADDMGAWFTSLLDYVRGAESDEPTVDVERALSDTLALLDPFFRQHRIRLVRSIRPLRSLPGAESSYRQVFFNLLQNAAEAMEGRGGVVAVGARPRPGAVEVTIQDSGPGLPSGISDWIYEPLRSNSDGGAGLGLFVTRKLVLELGGTIRAANRRDGGAIFTLRFPV